MHGRLPEKFMKNLGKRASGATPWCRLSGSGERRSVGVGFAYSGEGELPAALSASLDRQEEMAARWA